MKKVIRANPKKGARNKKRDYSPLYAQIKCAPDFVHDGMHRDADYIFVPESKEWPAWRQKWCFCPVPKLKKDAAGNIHKDKPWSVPVCQWCTKPYFERF